MTVAAICESIGDVNEHQPFEILGDEQCWELLGGEQFGRLAVSVAGRPDIYPVNFIIHNGVIVFRTAEGSKLASMAINAAVAFEVDGYNPDTNEAWSVVVHGQAKLVEHSPDEDELEHLPLFPWNLAPKNRLVKVEAFELSGRRFVAEGRRG
ncbi:MAG: pyridoxamine 5'-phosphate oxidase family protein [Actinobacteria bacterium]|nr:pyridoxamine 5'-phosphate oxidase family protein [Actinomycetota bacterium]